ncbi:hypothetical protein Tco_0363864 [Tanacetum coccineum]
MTSQSSRWSTADYKVVTFFARISLATRVYRSALSQLPKVENSKVEGSVKAVGSSRSRAESDGVIEDFIQSLSKRIGEDMRRLCGCVYSIGSAASVGGVGDPDSSGLASEVEPSVKLGVNYEHDITLTLSWETQATLVAVCGSVRVKPREKQRVSSLMRVLGILSTIFVLKRNERVEALILDGERGGQTDEVDLRAGAVLAVLLGEGGCGWGM